MFGKAMRFVLMAYVFCICVFAINAHQHGGGKTNGKDNDNDKGGDIGRDNGRDNGNGKDNGDESFETDDRDEDGCRCASYCSPDEYLAGTCDNWWRQSYCCRYETCGKCRCATYCDNSEVFKGYCDTWQRKCCPRCKSNNS